MTALELEVSKADAALRRIRRLVRAKADPGQCSDSCYRAGIRLIGLARRLRLVRT